MCVYDYWTNTYLNVAQCIEQKKSMLVLQTHKIILSVWVGGSLLPKYAVSVETLPHNMKILPLSNVFYRVTLSYKVKVQIIDLTVIALSIMGANFRRYSMRSCSVSHKYHLQFKNIQA